MSPIPFPRHQSISGKIHAALLRSLSNIDGCHCEVYQPIDLKIDESTVLHPDLSVVCKPIEKHFLDFPPALVVEIISPSTALKDKITKLELYQNFGIKYYLIVDPDANSITYYVLDEDGKYREEIKPPTIELHDDCSITPDFSTIW